MFGFFYRNVLRPILFLLPADFVHFVFLKKGEILGKFYICRYLVKKVFDFEDKSLNLRILGIDFKNPVGLSAGFDYDARLINILSSIGFGFGTMGTLTREAYSGNPRPMLGRLPKSRALLVNKGFKNIGVEKALAKISNRKVSMPLGLSIGSTNKKYNIFSEIVDDIYYAVKKVNESKNFEYFELNISCPNLINLSGIDEKMDSPEGLLKLLDRLRELGLERPLFIKMPLEKTTDQFDELVDVALKFDFVKGFVISNLVKDRNNPYLNRKEVARVGHGNFSGKPTFEKSNTLISHTYQKYGRRFVIIGSGGIFSAKDAYLKIKLGASLVELITGMIYEGPQLIGDINKGLVKLLKKDGYNNISQAVGVIGKPAFNNKF